MSRGTQKSTSDVPICSVFAWFTNRWFGHVMSESKETRTVEAVFQHEIQIAKHRDDVLRWVDQMYRGRRTTS